MASTAKLKVIDTNNKQQVESHKKALDRKIQKLQTEKQELEKLEKERELKEKQMQIAEAKTALKKYPRLKLSKFRDEEEAFQMIAFNEGLKKHFTEFYPFVKDVIVGWLDDDIDDRSIHMKISTKTVPLERFVAMIGLINGSYT